MVYLTRVIEIESDSTFQQRVAGHVETGEDGVSDPRFAIDKKTPGREPDDSRSGFGVLASWRLISFRTQYSGRSARLAISRCAPLSDGSPCEGVRTICAVPIPSARAPSR